MGSSKSMILGCMVSCLAMATRCFWPPESRMGCSSLLSATPTFSIKCIPRSIASCRGIFLTVTGASMTFSMAVRCGNRLKSWKTIPVLILISRTVARLRHEASGPGSNRMPSTSTLPVVGSSRKFVHRNMVLLPEPERPKTTTISLGATSRETSFSTSFCPNLLANSCKTAQTFRNSPLPRESRIATLEALRPGIPMTPPPGCVPEPHR